MFNLVQGDGFRPCAKRLEVYVMRRISALSKWWQTCVTPNVSEL